MYAIFQSGGKQYRVNEGHIVRLEKLNVAIGKTIEFNQIMMIVNDNDIKIGGPFISSGKIIAEVINHSRKNKVMIVKFNRRKHFRKHQGHRQWFTDVKIISINF